MWVRDSRSKIMHHVEYTLRRELPVKGQILVARGEKVTAAQVIGQCDMPGESERFNLASILGASPRSIHRHLHRKPGEPVKASEVLAEKRHGFGRRVFRSPVDGILTNFNTHTGEIQIQRTSIAFSLEAGFEGVVTNIEGDRAIDITLRSSIMRGLLGIGLPTMGTIDTVTEYEDPLQARHIDAGCCDKIILSGGPVDYDVLKRAMAMGVRGIVASSIAARDYQEYLSQEFDGNESNANIKATAVILTEGFGRLRMHRKFWDFLSTLRGELVILDKLDENKPGVVFPSDSLSSPISGFETANSFWVNLTRQQMVRVIAGINFGKTGRVVLPELSNDDPLLGPGVDLVLVQLEQGGEQKIPRWNLEVIGNE